MYKYGKVIAFLATIGWLASVFAAFKGFAFWYAGFVFFFWLAMGTLNYRHRTSLWYIENRLWLSFRFFAILVIVSVFADYFAFQKLTDLWSYPHYNSWDDWARLYLIIYPFGGLALLEFVYFLSGIFFEKLRFVEKVRSRIHKLVDKVDIAILLVMILSPILFLV